MLRGNSLPVGEKTGSFPIAADDDAYLYDRHPNSIISQSLDYSLPASPKKGAPRCIGGEVGVAKNGVRIFNGLDAGIRDAVAWEVQDRCDGHPQVSGQYRVPLHGRLLPGLRLSGTAGRPGPGPGVTIRAPTVGAVLDRRRYATKSQDGGLRAGSEHQTSARGRG